MRNRVLRIVTRLVIAALFLSIAVWSAALAYGAYEAHRAASMLAQASRVQVGDSETSVAPLVHQYGGFRWKPDALPPKENWVDKDEYDYQKDLVSDYRYEIAVDPFGMMSRHSERVQRLLQVVRDRLDNTPMNIRAMCGLRAWGSVVELSMRHGRVQSVSAMVLLEGRTHWLGHEWSLGERMPHHEMSARPYLIGAANLSMRGGGGTAIENYLTPVASLDEQHAARDFNSACITSLRGCSDLCDLSPRAIEYLGQHPDAAWNIIPPKCH